MRKPEDVVARYGGEEFAAILPSTSEDDAFQVAERVRLSLADLGLPHNGSPHKIMTTSIGLATSTGASPQSALQLIGHADEALYYAKRAGRNRTMGWQERHGNRAQGAF